MSINRGLGLRSEESWVSNGTNFSVFESRAPVILSRTSTVPGSSGSEDESEPLTEMTMFKIGRK